MTSALVMFVMPVSTTPLPDLRASSLQIALGLADRLVQLCVVLRGVTYPIRLHLRLRQNRQKV